MGLTTGWGLKQWSWLMMMILSITIIAGCTRERQESPAGSNASVLIDDAESTVDEPDVVHLPTNNTDTPEPEPTATPEPVHETTSYTVQSGDTVSTVAEKYGITSQELREMNLLSTDDLQPGQVLRVPNTPRSTEEGTPSPTAGPFSYVVQAGDTLYSIAINFGVSPNEIIAANTLSNPNALFEGQSIIIPNYQPELSTTPVPDQIYTYIIQAGDTLLSIAIQFGVSAAAIIEANALQSPDNLVQGQTLVIPGYQGTADGTGQSTPSQQGSHVVEEGETLLIIAQTYGVGVNEIISANNLSNPDLLTPGQTLVIPGISAAEIEAANQIIHVVAAGEGLYGIARQYNVSAEALMQANEITNPNFITVGQELIIPSSP